MGPSKACQIVPPKLDLLQTFPLEPVHVTQLPHAIMQLHGTMTLSMMVNLLTTIGAARRLRMRVMETSHTVSSRTLVVIITRTVVNHAKRTIAIRKRLSRQTDVTCVEHNGRAQ